MLDVPIRAAIPVLIWLAVLSLKRHASAAVMVMHVSNAGASRLILRLKKLLANDQTSVDLVFESESVMTYPEITKKTSTPRYPLGSRLSLK